jgi:hypothetical protein
MTNATVPTDEMVEWLLENAVSPEASTEDNFRALIDAAWKRAQQKPSGIKQELESYHAADAVLVERLKRMQQLIRNLARKHRHWPVPEKFRWASEWGTAAITGIYYNSRNSYSQPEYVALRSRDETKGKPINTSQHFARIEINRTQVMVPLYMFHYSEGDLARSYRAAARQEQADKEHREFTALDQKRLHAEQELAKANRELKVIKEKQKSKREKDRKRSQANQVQGTR